MDIKIKFGPRKTTIAGEPSEIAALLRMAAREANGCGQWERSKQFYAASVEIEAAALEYEQGKGL